MTASFILVLVMYTALAMLIPVYIWLGVAKWRSHASRGAFMFNMTIIGPGLSYMFYDLSDGYRDIFSELVRLLS